MFPAFEKATGIKVNFNEQPDQDAMFAQAKLSLQTGALDVVEPTVDRIGGWAANGLAQGWDLNKLSMDNYLPGLADGKMGEMATVDGKRMIVLSVWGTEAIVYSKTERRPNTARPASAICSIRSSKARSACARHSALAAMGRYLDSTGKLPKPWLDSYKDEATMKELWDIALAEASKAKKNIAQFWSGENEAQAALQDQWRASSASTGIRPATICATTASATSRRRKARSPGTRVLSLMANAKNVDQAHEFAKWVATPEGSAGWASAFSANPVAKGAIELASNGSAGLLQLGASRRRDAEAVVVAGTAGLVHQAAWRIRRQVQGRLRRHQMETAGFLRNPAVFC